MHEGWLIPFGEVRAHSSHTPDWALLDPVHALLSASFLKVAGNRTRYGKIQECLDVVKILVFLWYAHQTLALK